MRAWVHSEHAIKLLRDRKAQGLVLDLECIKLVADLFKCSMEDVVVMVGFSPTPDPNQMDLLSKG